MSVVINNGWLDAVIGRSIRSANFIFMPTIEYSQEYGFYVEETDDDDF